MSIHRNFWGKHPRVYQRVGRKAPVVLVLAAALFTAGCEDAGNFNPFKPKAGAEQAQTTSGTRVKTVERDVEAPEVFQVTEAGLWDGRPSLGGVWVAHPEVKDPERVVIRNPSNGKFVIGALFRRERENPGPRLQISSDAAEALGMLAGQPTNVNVTALRREEVPQDPEQQPDVMETPDLGPDAIEETPLDPIASAAAAIEAADAAPAATTPKPTPKPRPSGLTKPYIQIGIFSVETNARNTATALRTSGIVPTVRKQSSSGKTFWRVIIGPATSASERAGLLKKVKASGFSDAYAVTN